MGRFVAVGLAGAALMLAIIVAPATANAVTCYAQVGGACVKKSYGNLDSTCTNACAVALYMFKDASGNMLVAGGGLENSAAVNMGTKGTRPASCPIGTFYEGPPGQIIACEDDVAFTLQTPKAGSKTDGKLLPGDAMMLEIFKNN
jgi:hypothetical protein